ncbi:MAG: helix-turn-helix domain-containing protein [Asticcacaulis sp.]
MGRSADYSKEKCAVAGTLDVIGEPWTLLIIRDSFRGLCRFEQWQDALGLARNVLATRLKHLVAAGIFEPRLYCERPRRYEYILTPKGEELRPVILHMLDWGHRHVFGAEDPLMNLVHVPCGHILRPVIHCAHCDMRVSMKDMAIKMNPQAPSLSTLLNRPEAAEPIR